MDVNLKYLISLWTWKLHSLFEKFFLNPDKVKEYSKWVFPISFFFPFNFCQFTQIDQHPFTESTAAGKGTQEVFILVFLMANFHVFMRQNQNFAIKKSTGLLKTVHCAIEN